MKISEKRFFLIELLKALPPLAIDKIYYKVLGNREEEIKAFLKEKEKIRKGEELN